MRSKRAKKRLVLPDELYGDHLVTRLINRTMRDGKKSVAQKQIYNTFEQIKEKTKKDPVEIYHQALDNIKPTMEVHSRRVGGAAYQVPAPVKGDRKEALAIRWMIEAARKRSSSQYHTFSEKMTAEILDAFKGEGEAVRKKETSHKMADANKAFAHFRW